MNPAYNNMPPPPEAEAGRWLAIAEKLLSTRDLLGSKTFAIRARESDPRLAAADQILAIADTLIAADNRDWYSVLQLPRLTDNLDLIAAHYRRIATVLNPARGRLAFGEEVFGLVSNAWSVLSNPTLKSQYDNEMSFLQNHRIHNTINNNNEINFLPQPPQQNPRIINSSSNIINNANNNEIDFLHLPPQNSRRIINNNSISSSDIVNNHEINFPPQQNPSIINNNPNIHNNEINFSPPPQQNPRNDDNLNINSNESNFLPQPPQQNPRDVTNVNNSNNEGNELEETFWTMCPYCYNMYEYPKAYEECSMRCQNCRRAFHGAKVASPPLDEGNGDTYLTWGFYPLGVCMDVMEKNEGGVGKWTPFSPMFPCPNVEGGTKRKVGRPPGPVVYIDDEDDDVFFDESEPSEESDNEWGSTRTSKKKKRGRKGRPRKKPQNENVKSITEGTIDEVLQVGAAGEEGSVGVRIGPKTVGSSGKRQAVKVPKELEKLDLNVEFDNEVEDPAPGAARERKIRPAHGGEDGEIEGIGFFEGLDEFLSSLPILNGDGDDKVKAD